jgi:hypothetical protein
VFRRPSFLFIIWVVVGILVAADRNYLTDLDSISRILSAALAVLAWPLVLLNINVAI